MNKSNIEWTDCTWNPMTGCLHGCTYCYARRIAENPRYKKSFPKGFAPDFHDKRLGQPGETSKPQAVFVGSMTDMMGEWWTRDDINAVIEECHLASQHTFLWLTKNPGRYADFIWPSNCWLGATVTGPEDLQRASHLYLTGQPTFISLEPLLAPLDLDSINSDFSTEAHPGRVVPWHDYIKQVIAGCQTGPGALPADPAWFKSLKEQCEAVGVPFFLKKVNKKTHLLDGREHKELAWGLNK